jgi:hypothetical protein
MPVFNGVYRSEYLLSIFATPYLRLVLAMDKYHTKKGDKVDPSIFSLDCDTAYAKLEALYKKYTKPSQTQWQCLFTSFFCQLKALLEYQTDPDNPDKTVKLDPMAKIKTTHKEFLEPSEKILNQILTLFKEIRNVRIAWHQELISYVGIINNFIEQTRPDLVTSEQQIKNCVPFTPIIFQTSAHSMAPVTQCGAARTLTRLDVAMGEMDSMTEIRAAQATHLHVDTLISPYVAAIKQLEAQLSEDRSLKAWLEQFLKITPDTVVDLDLCLNLTAASALPAIDPAKPISNADWLYKIANIHLVTKNVFAAVKELQLKFSTDAAKAQPFTKIHPLLPTCLQENFSTKTTSISKFTAIKIGDMETALRRENPIVVAIGKAKHLETAYAYTGPEKTLSWLNLLIQFRQHRLVIRAELKAYVCELRNDLKEALCVSQQAADMRGAAAFAYDFRENEWLYSLIGGLYFGDEEPQLKHNPDMHPGIFESSAALLPCLKTVIQHLTNLKNGLHALDSCGMPHLICQSPEHHAQNHKHLVEICQGIKIAYLDVTMGQKFRTQTYPDLKATSSTPVFQKIIEALNPLGGITAAMRMLETSNLKLPNPIEKLKEVCKIYANITVELEVDSEVPSKHKIETNIITSIIACGEMAKTYLPHLGPAKR